MKFRPLVHGLQLAEQVLQCQHHFSTYFLAGDSITSTWPCPGACWHPGVCDSPSWSSASVSFCLFWGRTVWAILDHPLVEFQCSFSMASLTAMDFHQAQQLLYVGLLSAMSFHPGCCVVSISSRISPTSWSLNCSLHMVARSQPPVAMTTIARTSLMSAHTSNFLQWVHSSWHGPQERALALLCFQLWQCPKWNCILGGAGFNRLFVPQGS
jgi:hypothetical protein